MNPKTWLSTIVGYTVVTLLCVLFISSDSVLSVFRVVLAFVYVAFFPGYCLLSFLFQEGKLDFPETLVLSVALSFSLAGISGLFLGLSPIGINIPSIVATLSGIVLALALLAYGRKTGFMKTPIRGFRAKTGFYPSS